jgi:hypothetical protein
MEKGTRVSWIDESRCGKKMHGKMEENTLDNILIPLQLEHCN